MERSKVETPEEIAARLLRCLCGPGNQPYGMQHLPGCAGEHREKLAAALRDAGRSAYSRGFADARERVVPLIEELLNEAYFDGTTAYEFDPDPRPPGFRSSPARRHYIPRDWPMRARLAIRALTEPAEEKEERRG